MHEPSAVRSTVACTLAARRTPSSGIAACEAHDCHDVDSSRRHVTMVVLRRTRVAMTSEYETSATEAKAATTCAGVDRMLKPVLTRPPLMIWMRRPPLLMLREMSRMQSELTERSHSRGVIVIICTWRTG